MNEFALLIDDEFQKISRYEERPPNLPHKLVTWHDVVREYGEPFEGLVDGNWVIRTVDPATLPPPVPDSISPRQCRLWLLQQNLLPSIEASIAQASEDVKISWEYAVEFRRKDPTLMQFATMLGLSDQAIDDFFIAAAKL
jgi:hypothetical protein